MRCELSFFWDEDDAVEVIESLYQIAANQKQDLILEVENETYVFPILMEERLRIQRAKNIYRKNSQYFNQSD